METKYWDAAKECMSRDELHELQTKRLKKLVKRVYTNVPYYRNKMHEKGIMPEDIKTVEDLEHLPFTTKQDLRETYPFGLFAAPMEEIVRIHASSAPRASKPLWATPSATLKFGLKLWPAA